MRCEHHSSSDQRETAATTAGRYAPAGRGGLMPNQTADPIISEVRAVRDVHAARFVYDLAAVFRNIRAIQYKSGREYVRFPARVARTSVVLTGA